MGVQRWTNPLITALGDGPSLTAAAAATCLPSAARVMLPANFFELGKQLRLTASGRISCAVTTPGTARFDLRTISGAGTTVVAWDSQAIPLNSVGKTSVGWMLELLLTCRSIGGSAAATLLGQGRWSSESLVGSPAATAGGIGVAMLPFNTVPVVGAGFDSTIAQTLDLFFTQTVGTGAMTLHEYLLEEIG